MSSVCSTYPFPQRVSDPDGARYFDGSGPDVKKNDFQLFGTECWGSDPNFQVKKNLTRIRSKYPNPSGSETLWGKGSVEHTEIMEGSFKFWIQFLNQTRIRSFFKSKAGSVKISKYVRIRNSLGKGVRGAY